MDHVNNEGVSQRVKIEKNILYTVKEGRLSRFVTSCVGTAF